MYPSHLYGNAATAPAAPGYVNKLYTRAEPGPATRYLRSLYLQKTPSSPNTVHGTLVRKLTKRFKSIRSMQRLKKNISLASLKPSSAYDIYAQYDSVDEEEEEKSAASTIQRMFRVHRALKQAEDEQTWEAFKAIDEAQEWHVVNRMNKLKELQDTLCNIAGVDVRHSLPAIRSLKAFPCPTIASIKAMVAGFEDNRELPLTDAMAIVEAAILVFRSEASVVSIKSNKCGTVVVGDLHGSWFDLMHILARYGYPGTSLVQYVFNGDLVDRGDKSCEVLLTLLTLKLLAPKAVFINRGNHEDVDMNMYYGFADEAREKYGTAFYKLCVELFTYLPYATTLNENVVIMHGGLTSDENFTLMELAAYPRGPDAVHRYSDRQKKIVDDILWSDPAKSDNARGCVPSPRGKGMFFAKDITARFLRDNGMTLLVRSHEEQKSGYCVIHDGKLITIFSASDYGGHGNGAAVLFFNPGAAKPLAHEWERPKDKRMKRPASQKSRYDSLIQYAQEVIAEHNDELRAYWKAIDSAGTGRVSCTAWQDGMEKVVNLMIASYPALVRVSIFTPEAGCIRGPRGVDYEKFLDYYQDKYLKELEAFGSTLSWHHDAIDDLVAHLRSKKLDFANAFSKFDINKDGSLSMAEFRRAMRKVVSLDILSDQQIHTLGLHFDVDHDGKITKDEFLARLSEHEQHHDDGAKAAIPHLVWAEDRRQETLKRLRERLASKVPSVDALVEGLRKYDVDKDGRLNAVELTEAMEKEFSLTSSLDDLYELGLLTAGSKAAGTDSLMKFATRKNFPVASATVTGYTVTEARGFAHLWQPLVQYEVKVVPYVGAPWVARHRYSDFIDMRDSIIRECRGGAVLPTLPGGMFPIYGDSALRARQQELGIWLARVVETVTRGDRAPPVALRTFLLIPAGDVVYGPDDNNYPPVPIKLLARTLYSSAPMQTPSVSCGQTPSVSCGQNSQRTLFGAQQAQESFAPALGSMLLKLLYKYKVELKALLKWEETPMGMACRIANFRSALHLLNELEGFPLTKSQLAKFVEHVDKNRDGYIDYDELDSAVQKYSDVPEGMPSLSMSIRGGTGYSYNSLRATPLAGQSSFRSLRRTSQQSKSKLPEFNCGFQKKTAPESVPSSESPSTSLFKFVPMDLPVTTASKR
eukprot:TRINITY_DN3773_c0_g1_i6.p1 TRINITY_DN3773_c0_g1~~TRINITY_DN3773_c0_g1_i6.p1  ORF type:complete len:1149 (+),score=354.23 TRINITY_DN3773_c0_g1_i6:54-3500(+)